MGRRLRLALETLGPIFVKFGQVLSTRADLLPEEINRELSLLQDRVPPFAPALARARIEAALGRPLEDFLESFEPQAAASASIAQVHCARLKGTHGQPGRAVAIKVTRPHMLSMIERDLSWLRLLARVAEFFFSDARRLRLSEVVAEFDHYLHDELDLQREAANASQLRRNMSSGRDAQGLSLPLILVPEMFWDYCARDAITMEWMPGIAVSQIDALTQAGIDRSRLAREGVAVFFTQVFRDGFFHADMHPGNILVSDSTPTLGKYIALDFGIMGTLSDSDRDYLARNFLAFFRRDYRAVARLHIESGWAPRGTRVEALEDAVRSVCEPLFGRPLAQISFAHVLLRLFQVSRRFNIVVQPQLVLLQKTLLNIEGLGRTLDPNLNLWETAEPILARWVKRQIGWHALLSHLQAEAPHLAHHLPALPRLAAQFLDQPEQTGTTLALLTEQRRTNRLLQALSWASIGFLLGTLLPLLLRLGLGR